MPLDYIYTLAKDLGKSRNEIERLWKKAKEITKDTFGIPESNWGDREYSYTIGVIKKMIKKEKTERSLSMEFLKSKKSPDEFLEQVVSGDFEIGNVIPPGKKKKLRKNFGKERDINTAPGTGNYPLVITHESFKFKTRRELWDTTYDDYLYTMEDDIIEEYGVDEPVLIIIRFYISSEGDLSCSPSEIIYKNSGEVIESYYQIDEKYSYYLDEVLKNIRNYTFYSRDEIRNIKNKFDLLRIGKSLPTWHEKGKCGGTPTGNQKKNQKESKENLKTIYYDDDLSAYYYNNILSGFKYFGANQVTNFFEEINSILGRVIRNTDILFIPERSRPAEVFLIKGGSQQDLDEAISFYKNKEEKATNGTSKCPGCGGKYLVATGYCPSCKKKVAEPKP